MCPNTVASLNVDPGMTGAIVTWSPSPTANDAVDGSIMSLIKDKSPVATIVTLATPNWLPSM